MCPFDAFFRTDVSPTEAYFQRIICVHNRPKFTNSFVQKHGRRNGGATGANAPSPPKRQAHNCLNVFLLNGMKIPIKVNRRSSGCLDGI